MKKTVVMFMLALIARVVSADVVYSPFAFGSLLDASGAAISSGTYLMVLDLDGDGWDLNSISSDSWLFDSDDMVFDRGTIENGDAFPFYTLKPVNEPAGYDVGIDQYYLFWFDKAYNVADVGPGASVNFGIESLGTVGSVNSGNTYTPDLVGGNAQYQTVPEPATALLALIGGGMAYALRRNTRRSIYQG